MQYGGDAVKAQIMGLMPVGYSMQGNQDMSLQQYNDALNRRRAELDAQRRMEMMGLQDGLQRGPAPQRQPLMPSMRFEMFGARSPMEYGA